MSDQRKGGIAWTDETWNPIRGCTRVSTGCENCYAEKMAARFCGPGMPYEGTINPETNRWNGKIRLVPEKLTEPLHWTLPRRIFVNSMSDLFHPEVPYEFIDRVFAVMALAKQHIFQVLTKRPERMLEYFKSFHTKEAFTRGFNVCAWAAENFDIGIDGHIEIGQAPKGLPNVWLGVTAENQQTADLRIPLLLQTPAAVRWVSMEPLLGSVDMRHGAETESGYSDWLLGGRYAKGGISGDEFIGHTSKLDWVIVGAESGHNARPMNIEWVRNIVQQCKSAGVPVLVKQLSGENGKVIKDISLFPVDLQIREYPNANP